MSLNQAVVKDMLSIVAISLTFIGYIPYIRDIFSKKTKPHMYTWLVWWLFTAVVFFFQYANGGGGGSWVTGCAACVCLYIFGLSFRYGTRDVTVLDKTFLIISLFIGVVWFFTSDPVLTTILLCCADVFGFVPTIRKSWKNPYEETLSSYAINSMRFLIAIYVLREYNIITLFYPVSWMFANGLFAMFLIWRRQIIVNKNLKS